jgi:hypothetical protein
MKIITIKEADRLIRESARLEKDKARVTLMAQREAAETDIAELKRQNEALRKQAEYQTEARNVDAERINDLVRANGEQFANITKQQGLIDDQKKVIAFERENAATWKTALERDDNATLAVQLQKRVEHLQNKTNDEDAFWDTVCNAVIEVANDAGYCEEFDGMLENVNEILEERSDSYRRFRRRTKEYYVMLTLEVTVDAATDEDDAITQAKEALDCGSYDSYTVSEATANEAC